MKKKKGTALFLVICMVASLFTGIPVNAAEEISGLAAKTWIDWDEEGTPSLNPEAGFETESWGDLYGATMYFSYVENGEETAVTEGEIKITTPEGTGAGDKVSVQANEKNARFLDFSFQEMGDYKITYTGEGEGNKDVTLHVSYPEVGFYTSGEASLESLIKNEQFQYMNGEDNTFYMIFYRNPYSKLDLDNIMYKKNGEVIQNITQYFTITKPENAKNLSDNPEDYIQEEGEFYVYEVKAVDTLVESHENFWLDVTVPKVDVIENENENGEGTPTYSFVKDDSGNNAYYEIGRGIDIQYREKMVGLVVTDNLEWNEETEITSVAKEAEFKKSFDYFRPGISVGICLATRESEEGAVTEIPITDVKICDSDGNAIFNGADVENYNNIEFGETIYNTTDIKIGKIWQPATEAQNETDAPGTYYDITFKKNGTYTVWRTGNETATDDKVTIEVSYSILGVYRTNEVKENTLIDHTDYYGGREKTVYLLTKNIPEGYTLTNVKVQMADGRQDNFVSYNENTKALTINKAASGSFGIEISADIQNKNDPLDKWEEGWYVDVTDKRGRVYIEDHKPHMGYAACFISKDEFDKGGINYDEGLDPLYFVHGSTIQEVIDILYDTVDQTVENEDGVTFRVKNTGYIHVNMSYIPGDVYKDSSGNTKKDANGDDITYESIAMQTQYVTTPFDVHGVQMETGRDPYFATTVNEDGNTYYYQVAQYQKLGSNETIYVCRKDDVAYYAVPDNSLISQYKVGDKLTEAELAELESDYEKLDDEWQTEFRWPELHVDATTEIKITGRFGTENDPADPDLYLGFFEDDAYDIRPQVYNETYDKTFIGQTETIECPDSIEEYAGETVTIKGVKLTSDKKVNSTFGKDTAIDEGESANILRDKVVISDNDAMQKIIDGEPVTVSLNVSAVDDKNAGLGTEVKTGVKGIQTEIEKTGDAKIQYLDIGLGYKVGKDESDEAEGAITKTTADVEISTKLPSTFIEQGGAVGKNGVLVYRYHDGKVDELNATYENGKLTFKTDRFSVYAFAVKATGIQITTAPTKTVYTVGESFDKSGMVVELIYADGSKKVITDYKAPTTALTKADKEITVTYGNFTAKQKITVKAASATPAPGDTKRVNGSNYKVTSVAGDKKAVTYVSGNKNAKKITVPSAITIDGTQYKVTAIAANAFSGCKKLKTVNMGANVTTIGDKAFYKCTTLNKVTIPAKVTKIGKQAFYGCKKLKTITIKTTKLTSKKVGSKAFKGIYSKATIKVPKKKLKAYKKILKAKGVSSKAKIKK